MSLEEKIKTLEKIKKGELTISMAAKNLNVSRQTVYTWLKEIHATENPFLNSNLRRKKPSSGPPTP